MSTKPGTGFVHPALFYSGSEEYLAGVGGFVREGLAAGAPVFVAVPPDRLALLTEHLGADADRVCLVDMSQAGRNPGRILTALTDFAARCGDRRAWLVGEPIWGARTPAEIREATRHEALINLAFEGIPATILCPYDLDSLPAATLADAERTHPELWDRDRRWLSARYTDPMAINAGCDAELAAEPPDAERFPFGPAELLQVRRHATEFARSAGLRPDRLVDLKLAVGEAASNAIRHGGGAGTLTLWCDNGSVIVDIQDRGRLANPLAGRRRPPLDAPGGRGLWMIHQLCDLVELGPGRLRMHIA